MNFVEEQNARAAVFGRFFYYFADVFLAGADGGEFVKMRVDGVGVNARERGLARAGRAPQDKRKYVPLLDRQAQRFPGTYEMFLPDKLIQSPGPDPVRQRLHSNNISSIW